MVQSCRKQDLSGEVGVWVGIQQMEYGSLAARCMQNMGAYTATGTPFSVAAGRISYIFGFKGPAVSLAPLSHKLWLWLYNHSEDAIDNTSLFNARIKQYCRILLKVKISQPDNNVAVQVSIDTACSSALVATNAAAQYLHKKGGTSLSAAVNLMLAERTTAATQVAGVKSVK